MLVNLHKGVYFCFGCNASGDAFSFIKSINPNLGDLEQYFLYYKILKSKKVKALKYKSITKRHKASSEQLLIEAIDYYYNLKSVQWGRTGSHAEAYMKRRGFFPKALNLCKAKFTYNDFYPIVFPMFDMGEFKGYVCRTTSKRIEKKRKYLYNEGFSRINTLVGDYNYKRVIIVEGYMDRLKFLQFGVKNVVAILGWKITQPQVDKLQAMGVKEVISALDNDKCGKEGTKYLGYFFDVKKLYYPPGIKDPGDFNKDSFEEARNKTLKRLGGRA